MDVNDAKWCRPSVFIINFKYLSHLSLVFFIGNIEQVIVCYDIIFTLYILILWPAVDVYKFIL